MKIYFKSNRVQLLRYKDYEIKYLGLPIILGKKAGIESLKCFCDLLDKNEIIDVSRELLGIYFIVMKNIVSNTQYVFVDNIGQFKIYITEKIISDSFLYIAEMEKCKSEDLNTIRTIEFIRFGTVFSNYTYFDKIKTLDSDSIIYIDEFDEANILKKKRYDINKNTNYKFGKTMKLYCNSIRDKKISIDITGGIDSRLLSCIFNHHNVSFEGGLSDLKGNEDAVIGKGVAEKLNIDFFLSEHNIDNLEKSFEKIFVFSDGICNIFKMHRL
ncbi:hypothetical protein KAU15_04105, partial [candidate division WOR-3 bacterium]|nr:hypothetical protein [candidate division WOR-3 bacterium]